MLLTSGAVIFVLAVTVVLATEIDTPQGVYMSLKSDGVEQDSQCIHCNSVTCIAKNANDSTYIRFVSEIFVLEDILHISNREDIRLEGTAQPETRIVCKERTSEPWREIGFTFTNIQNFSIVNITVHNCGMLSQERFLTRHVFHSAIFLVHCTSSLTSPKYVSATGSSTDNHLLAGLQNGASYTIFLVGTSEHLPSDRVDYPNSITLSELLQLV